MPPVTFIMIDGLRPDALSPERTPRLDAFMQSGAYTLAARSVMPSITLPCHTSIFHSVPPDRHGILDNTWHSMARPVVGLVEMVKAVGKRSAFFYNWEPLRDLNRPEHLDFSFFVNSSNELGGDTAVAEAAVKYIPAYNFDFTFVYLGVVDTSGHLFGWMSDGYLQQVAETDRLVGMVLDVVLPHSTVIIHADHGGHERNHGTEMPEDMTIPWMIGGAGVCAGHAITHAVSLLDTAPTIAHVLGIAPPAAWEGSAITEVFQ